MHCVLYIFCKYVCNYCSLAIMSFHKTIELQLMQ